ncbi:MAG: 2Fe-2S iron-sulfur cluster-binding protein [Bacteroidota bacterium]|nr:2Fe-2S iron-sulfur cluster-binding protein [Bacteroidota bacterium]MDP4234944.1 2Fe-2S iron-sulfur cluster-binding protein [Bacteroidota bacterium]
MSHDTTGKSSLERHKEAMKPGGVAHWFFGESGGTVSPTYAPPAKAHDHDEPQVSEAYAAFFKENPEKTDEEYQKIRKDRTVNADLKDIPIPEGYAPVTFVEDDVIIIAPIGSNLRKVALDNNIELYGDVMKFLNCRGLGLCTSCRVTADPNDALTPPTKMEKVHLIRDNPKYRLSCQCEVLGPVKVSTKPAKDYGKLMNNFVRNVSLLGFFSLIMLTLLLVIGFDVVGKWF